MTSEVHELEWLLARIAEGDRPSFARLYSATSAKLFGIVLRIVGDRGDAEDVLQETYVRVWRAAGRFDSASGRPVTWLAAIARNAAIDFVRQHGARRARAIGGEEGELRMASVATDEFALSADPANLHALGACLGLLEPEHRDCVVLAYRDGLSRDELASRFGRPVGTIKTWLHRALARLKDCLDDG